MRLRIISTGSKGNCYLLEADDGTLVLDAGVPVRRISYACDDFGKIEGCLITHEHGDHIRGARECIMRGIPTYMSRGTANAANIRGAYLIGADRPIGIGPFTVLPVKAQHDAAEPLAYLIRHDATGETALYATDTYYLRNTFPTVNYWIVECNYIDDLISDDTEAILRDRLAQSHMSLKHLKGLFEANDLRPARKIVLVHLSDERSDEARMVREIAELTGVETVAARDGDDIALDIAPF